MVALNSLDGQAEDRNVFSLPMSNVLPRPASVPSVILNGAFAVAIASLHSTDKDPFIDHEPADKCALARAACAFVAFGMSCGSKRGMTGADVLCRPENPRNMPLLDAAKVSPDGSTVTHPKEMYQIFFLPTLEVRPDRNE